METKQKKQELRNYAKNIRKMLDIKTISIEIHKRLIATEEYQNAKNIFAYYSFRDEVSTHALFEDKEKFWYLPRAQGAELEVCEFDAESLRENCFGIKEPDSDEINELISLDTIIMPALMGDKSGNRLGYGKGYYDGFLNLLSHSPKKILLIPEELLREELPTEPHDKKCDIIITQCNIYRF